MRINKRNKILIIYIFLLTLLVTTYLAEYIFMANGNIKLYYLAVFFRGTIIVSIGVYIASYLNRISKQINVIVKNLNDMAEEDVLGKYTDYGVNKIERIINNLWDKLVNERNGIMYNDASDNEFRIKKFLKEVNKLFNKYSKEEYTVIKFNIDKFEYINEIYGHEYSNVLINYISDMLHEFINKDEISARWHNYNFLLLLRERDETEIVNRINYISSKFAGMRDNNQKKLNVHFSFGIYKVENDINNIEQMIDKARIAQKIAKLQSDNELSYVFYNSNIKKKIIEEQKMESLMYEALENNEFKVYMQGKNDLNSFKISGAEALVRWNSSELGFISPADFITLFEKNGFIVELDFFVFEEVCKHIRKWLDDGIEVNITSVNQSKRHLDNDNYVSRLKDIIEKYDIPGGLIELEITETAITDNVEKLVKVIDELHKLGFKISIDDFGSGYSSLNMLKQINADILKIDKEFLNEAYESKKSKTIIKHVIKMAKELEIQTITEGVESVEQADFLRNIGCDMAQGFLYSKPQPIDDFAEEYYYKDTSMC